MTTEGLGAARRTARGLTAASLAVLALLAALAAGGPWLAGALGIESAATNLLNRSQPPSLAHPFGTDALGRDYFVRVLEGGRVSLVVGLGGAVATAALGTLVGLVAGYAGGRTDALLMRLTDVVIALPILPLLLIVAAIDLAKLGLAGADDGGVARLVVIVALFGWPSIARVARAQTLSVRRRTYVLAAEALGAGAGRVVGRHILPNVAGPVLVAATLNIGNVILAESVLSFLGLGIQPPTPSWGNLLSDAQTTLAQAPHLAVLPGLAIFVTVIAFNVLGDGLQALLDRRR
ncbi:MAG: ABC transporter permease [Alphaproteobacteria bacterium]